MRWRIQFVPGRALRIDRFGQRQRAGDVQRAGALREHVGQRHEARGELQRAASPCSPRAP